jgi:hypothetical protein
MTRRSHLHTILMPLSFSLIVGCGLSDPQPPTIRTDSGVPQTDGQGQKMQRPTVDPLPPSACADTIPLMGNAPAGSSVFVIGGGTSGLATDAHPVTGRFCMDVPLKKNTVNNFEVRAQDPILGMSEPEMVSISHTTCNDDVPDPTPEQVPSQNVALGAQGTESESPDEGNVGFLTDGKASTSVTYSGGYGWGDFGGWVSLKLDKVYMASKIVVRWRDGSSSGGSEYGAKYSVLYSSMSDPGDPDLKNGYWTVIEMNSGDGGEDLFSLESSKPLIRHVAIWMKQDGASWTWSETFAIAEVEVWDAPQQGATTPTGNSSKTCSNSSTAP